MYTPKHRMNILLDKLRALQERSFNRAEKLEDNPLLREWYEGRGDAFRLVADDVQSILSAIS